MATHETRNRTPAAADQREAAGRDRRTDRTVDLSEAEIAAIEAQEMTPDFPHPDALSVQEPNSMVEEGLRYARDLRQRGDRTKRRAADKGFRDSLYEES